MNDRMTDRDSRFYISGASCGIGFGLIIASSLLLVLGSPFWDGIAAGLIGAAFFLAYASKAIVVNLGSKTSDLEV